MASGLPEGASAGSRWERKEGEEREQREAGEAESLPSVLACAAAFLLLPPPLLRRLLVQRLRPTLALHGPTPRTRLPMTLGVPTETQPGERRVAMTPDAAGRLAKKSGYDVLVQRGAGEAAGFVDAAYEAAGARLVSRKDALGADVVCCVQAPNDRDALKEGAVLVGFLSPLDAPETAADLARRGVTALAMELVPRTTRAQRMDALSAMSTVAGYKAALLAASHLPKFFPLLDHRRRHAAPGAAAGARRRRGRAPGARDGAPPRRHHVGLRHPRRRRRAGPVRGREVRHAGRGRRPTPTTGAATQRRSRTTSSSAKPRRSWPWWRSTTWSSRRRSFPAGRRPSLSRRRVWRRCGPAA